MRHGVKSLLWPALAAALAAPACFNPPSGDVQFSCDPAGADACPPGYACGADGCCRKDGLPIEGEGGECKLGSGPATGGPQTGGPQTGGPTTSATGSTTSTTGSTSDAGTTGASTSGTTGASTSGTSSTGGPQTTGA